MEVSMELKGEPQTQSQPQQQQLPLQQIPHNVKRSIFNPPLATQRYCYIQQFIDSDPSILTVTDAGCGNGRLVVWLKTVAHLEQINFIDKDFSLLENEMDHHMRPNFLEMVFGRKGSDKDLELNVYQGDVMVPDERLKSDCFTLVEMIEHISLEQLEQVSRTVFGFYQPRYVVVTTPNKEFNHLLRQEHEAVDKFRHWDHKFEWTRAEFVCWTEKICSAYNYQAYFDGVGQLPGSEQYGPCTQIAVFKRMFEPTQSVDNDLSCLDLLINKLNVEKEEPEFVGDRELKRICLLKSFTLPGATQFQVQLTPDSFWKIDDDEANDRTNN